MQNKVKNGFTLLEMMIAVSLISLLMTLSIGRWRDYKLGVELTNSSQELLTFIIRMQSSINWQNQSYKLNYDAKSCFLSVSNVEAPELNNIPDRLHIPCEKIDFTMPKNKPIAFHGKRMTTQGGTLQLQNDVGHVKIIVSSEGRIRRCQVGKRIAGITSC